jgi:hypothetical protein
MLPKLLTLFGLTIELCIKVWDLYVRIRKLKTGRKPSRRSLKRIFSF